MDAHDQMRTKFREEITELCKQYSHGDTSARARAVLAKIQTLENARLMWGVIWKRYGTEEDSVALHNYIIGINATIKAMALARKPTSGWEAARAYAEDLLKLSPR